VKIWRTQRTAVNIGAFLVCLFVLRVCGLATQLLSYDQFQAIQCEQTLADVEGILERKGEIRSSSTFSSGLGGEYLLENVLFGDGNGSYISVDFLNGGVSGKLGDQLIGSPNNGYQSVNCPARLPDTAP
jgi:hypothetical protein